jgi:hypothetical protein
MSDFFRSLERSISRQAPADRHFESNRVAIRRHPDYDDSALVARNVIFGDLTQPGWRQRFLCGIDPEPEDGDNPFAEFRVIARTETMQFELESASRELLELIFGSPVGPAICDDKIDYHTRGQE